MKEKPIMRTFKCANGFTYEIPDNFCVFCEHCTDIFYDYTNGPYMFICDIGKEYDAKNFECKYFEAERMTTNETL